MRSVQKRAVTAGMISSATTRISPTSFSPMTVTAITSPIIARSILRTWMPEAAAYSGSKDTNGIGRRNSTTAPTAKAPPTAMTTASWNSMPAVEPSRKLSSPACRPPDMVWMTVSSTMPKPKNTDRTAPIAASSARRVRREIHSTSSRPTMAETAEPSRRPGRLRPSPPSATIAMKASPMPGRVACATASLTSARLRRNRNVPPLPAATPSSAAPTATRAAL